MTERWSGIMPRGGHTFFDHKNTVTPIPQGPAWQQADDAQRIREQDRASRDALLKLLLAGAALLTLTAGGVGLFGLWYTRGRDPGVGAVASYLC